MYKTRCFLLFLCGTLAVGCGGSNSSSSVENATGGRSNVGGTASGGASSASTGGSNSPSSGGSTNTTSGTAIGGAPVGGGTTSAGGATPSGGSTANGGSAGTGGNGVLGGSTASGGATHSGGLAGSTTTGASVSGGGTASTGGVATAAGTTAVGGTSTAGGSNTFAGATNTGGSAGAGGTSATGGVVAVGGTSTTGGSNTSGGDTNVGGTSAAGGGTTTGGTSATSTATSTARGCFVQALADGNVNVYVIKDATPTGGDVEGNMYVGGNLVASSYTIGAKSTVDCNGYALVVGGNLSLGGGSVHGGKSAAGVITSVGGVTSSCGIFRASPVDFAPLQSEVESLSLAMAQLAPNGTVSTTTSAYNLTGTNLAMNVFEIDGSQMRSVNLTFPEGSTVVVNVSGTTVNWSSATVCLNGSCDDSSQSNHVIWNLYQAVSLTAQGIAIEGSVVAPLATIDSGGGHIAGQVMVRDLEGALEYRPYPFRGCIRWP
jgi:choice-of-anchor A domain-containing protein